MSDELKPCPFCGGEAKAFYCEESGTFDVQCQQCGAIPFIGSRTSERKTMADVIAAWNARAAVTDGQFAMAVHNGEAWQRVRTCLKVPGKMHYGERRPKGSECGYGLGDSRWAYCPSCGAKVAG